MYREIFSNFIYFTWIYTNKKGDLIRSPSYTKHFHVRILILSILMSYSVNTVPRAVLVVPPVTHAITS